MHIINSDLQLSSTHDEARVSWQSTEIKVHAANVFEQMFSQAKAAATSAATSAKPSPATVEGHDLQLMLEARRKRFQTLLEMLFGDHPTAPTTASMTPIQAEPSLLAAPTTAPTWFEFTTITQVAEVESCSMSGRGNVCLADGSQRQFGLDFSLSREATFSLAAASQSVLRDPLVLDFGAPSMALAHKAVSFDLDADGKAESLRLPQAEMLFIDRNGNGKVDNGRELFGAQSGDGFAELAQLDTDHNGWVDSGDAAFVELKLWQGGLNQIRTLAEAGVGALSVQSVSTPMSEKSADVVLAKMRASGVWLGETAGLGSIRQIDLNTEA
ncbi:hypothetical protein HQ393_12465 [Chitinibacter bivalviorum]|uniref:VCBS repeat-containing protein n=1 Tax=Chitinibacter bivalviorum TaxID=2739434 RepID=A0A7H9BNS8_9NEIS|nr:hypothetical protein [Chitinibacter bivalviorum]QLG88984.1 hypothetical protein HQ393_12465 [Chitinibacter bivalviorum]